MTFAQRMAQGVAAEQRIRASLESCGFIVEPFGQAELTEQLRTHLRSYSRTRPLVRWLVDMVAWRHDGLAYAIDVKDVGRAHETGNYSIECASTDAMNIAAALFAPIPVLYVWSDGACATPAMVEADAAGPFPGRGTNGSGTDFKLMPCDATQPWPWSDMG